MRIALLTDLHANREALDACLAHAGQRGADKYAFTGDLVGYGGDPARVLDTVMEHAAQSSSRGTTTKRPPAVRAPACMPKRAK